MHVVLIETSSNQRYIFATNKLRENVGASELIYRVGTQFVLEAVNEETHKTIYEDNDFDGSKLRANLLNPLHNPRIGNGHNVEVITATSGKALLLTSDRPTGEKIIRTVTSRTLREMPGLTVHGAISDVFTDLNDVHKFIVQVHRKQERVRLEMPSNEQRFLRLPFVAPCNTSGLPASEIFDFKNEQGKEVFAFSKVTTAKRQLLAKDKQKLADKDEFDKGRIVNLLEKTFALTLPTNLARFESTFPKSDWLAVIHADGNGLGEIFLKFDEYSKSAGREYVETYRRFSLALDLCTINAAGLALKNLQNWFVQYEATDEIPVVPLILGGDDMTVLCSGRFALKFTTDFLNQFEKETSAISQTLCIDGVTIELDYLKDVIGELDGVIPQIANNAFGNNDENNPSIKRLGICAGVAIVKPHFPFHQAYQLAESLLRSAKQVKARIHHFARVQTESEEQWKEVSLPASALDFHILYDSAYSELDAIRGRISVEKNKTRLFAKPYVVSNIHPDEIKFKQDGETDKNKTWFANRKFSRLASRVKSMGETDPDDPNKRALPNNQLHALREALFLGKPETDARTRLVDHRYRDKGFGILLCDKSEDKPSLFFSENGELSTHFMDALDVVEFWRGFPTGTKQNGGEVSKDE